MKIYKKNKENKNIIDIIKWCIIILIIIITVIINYYYRNISYPIRLIFFLTMFTISGIISIFTFKGKSAVNFILESKTELKKILWPSKKETFYTTLIISIITVIISLIFWSLDTLLVIIISFFTNLRFF